MRSSYLIALCVTALFGVVVFWYQNTAAICPAPLAYRIGEIDPEFNITKDQALAYAKQAEAVWENQAKRELFEYDEKAILPIHFLYDDRQATADSEVAQRRDLDVQKEKSEEVQRTLSTLQTEYDKLTAVYTDRAAAYETKLQAYNTEVNKYNDRGGAPPDIFAQLEEDRKKLSYEADELNTLSAELAALAEQINTLVEEGNSLVNEYNEAVSVYNQSYGFAREFTQGDYQGDEINIYKFSSDAEVITVLAHEFGHALGLGHVEGSSSLMYYLLGATNEKPTLSSEDSASYGAVCGEVESFAQKSRRLIREVLATIR
jgi:uncharacterized protein YukE